MFIKYDIVLLVYIQNYIVVKIIYISFNKKKMLYLSKRIIKFIYFNVLID